MSTAIRILNRGFESDLVGLSHSFILLEGQRYLGYFSQLLPFLRDDSTSVTTEIHLLFSSRGNGTSVTTDIYLISTISGLVHLCTPAHDER